MKRIPLLLLLLAMAFAATAATWTGTVSTNWNSVLNWDTGVIPTSTTNVIIPVIPSLRYPITTSVTGICHNLTVNAGARVTVGAFDLIVSGDALINGQLAQTSNTDFEVSGNITWGSGATAAISNSGAEIYCYGNMTFAVGSNVQLGMGYLEFCGVDNSCYLTNNSTATELYNVRSACTGQFLTFSASSNADIVINGSFWNYAGSRSYCYYEGNVIIKGPWLRDFNTDSTAGLRWFYGSLVMDGVSQTIDLQGPYCYLQELHINPTTSVTLDSDLELKGDLHLETGYLAAGSHQIEIGGSWNNTATADAFYEGTSTVVFTGDATQYCHDSEHFYILTVDKTAGYLTLNNSSVVVSCASYDWMQGGVEVNAGVFAANTLADNCIAGTWYLHATGYINLYAGSTGCIDLAGDLHITGGTFTVYGGASNVKKTVNTGMVNFVNATGAFSGEAYDADEYYRIHWTVATASPDLQILRAAWTPSAPLPYMGDTRTLIVTVANASLNPLTTDHWLDLYFDPAIPPVEDQSGDLWQLISDLPASLPVDLTFNVSNFDSALEGVWDSYLYLDSFGAVTETVETNNIFGPFTIIWQLLPVIDDLTIEPDPDIPGNVRLDWTYDLSVTRFDIMRASDPYGTFIYLAGSAASQFSTPFAARQFYQVKAVRLPAKQAENPPRNLP